MDILTWIHQGTLYMHLAAFAIAFSAVLREDVWLLKSRRIDLERLADTARLLTAALVALWLTGLGLMAFDIGLDPQALLSSGKPAAKLVVVAALTVNGIALHALAFPILRGAPAAQRAGSTVPARRAGATVPLQRGATLPVILGAISTASWLHASFIGVSRLVASSMTFGDYMALYGMLVAGAIGCALVFVRPRVERLLLGAG